MKKLYFVPLFVVSSFILPFIHVNLITFSATLSFNFMEHEHTIYNLIILRGFGVLASVLAAFLVALPMGYISKRKGMIYGWLMPLVGIIIGIAQYPHETFAILRQAWPSWASLVIACVLFWYAGYALRNKNQDSHLTTASSGHAGKPRATDA